MRVDELRSTLARQAFLYDDPGAYLAGVRDALALVVTDGRDRNDGEDETPSPSVMRPSA